jgi:uncharacterized metal-binding protein
VKAKTVVIPCSGIGKAFGSVSREATYIVVDELRPDAAETTCLSLLTMGDEDTCRLVCERPTITIDGCPTGCARVNVEASGGKPVVALRVVDTYREHRELRAESVLDLGPGGQQLARVLAEKVVAVIDGLESPTKEE